MAKASVQSIEPKVADIVNGWLKENGLTYFLEQEKLMMRLKQH